MNFDTEVQHMKNRQQTRAVWHGFKKPRFFRLFYKPKNLKSPNLGFLGLKNENLMSDLSF